MNVEGKKENEINKEYRTFAKNSLYLLLNQYSSFVFLIITSFLLARLLSREIWNILIIGTSWVMILAIISYFLPPALEYSLIYYIPRYTTLNQNNKLKSLLKKALYFKIITLIIIFIISISLFQFILLIINVNYKEEFNNILFILSPLILIYGLRPVLNGINQGLNRFKLIFILFLIKSFINITLLIFCFVFISKIAIELIAIIIVLSESAPFIINCYLTLRKYYHIKETNEDGLTFKEVQKMLVKYGSPLSFNYLVSIFWNEIQIQGIAIINNPENVLGYNISMSYSNVVKSASTSLTGSLTTSFTRLNSSKNYDAINSLYNLIIKYSLFILLLISGLMFFLADLYLFFVYNPDYLIYTDYLKLMVIPIGFRVLITPFDTLLYATNRTNYLPLIRIFMIIMQITLFFIGLYSFGIYGAILAIIIINAAIFVLYGLLNFKILKIELKISKLISQYISFFIALSVALSLDYFLFRNLYSLMSINANLITFGLSPIFSIIIFFITFISFNIALKIFSRKDIDFFESFFDGDSRFEKIIRTGLKIFKR